MINRFLFFNAVRADLFKGHLRQPQVKNIEILLNTWKALYPEADIRWIANSLAQIYHETAGTMEPVRETLASSDVQAMARLEKAWKEGRLLWVKNPYWREGYFGRGFVQLTHAYNYKKMKERLGIDLVANPGAALMPSIAAKIAIVGLVEGMFTGRRLSDYFNQTTNDPQNARHIINGKDGTEDKVADLHQRFLRALIKSADPSFH